MNDILVIIVLIALNGLFAMTEIALISVRKSYLANEIKKGSRSARLALKLAEEPDRFLSIIQIGITIIGILTGIYSGSVLADDFSKVIAGWGVSPTVSHPLAQSILVVGVTYLTLIFGELVPKRIGMSAAERVAVVVARPMHLLALLASPFVWLLSKSTSFVFNLFGLNTESGQVTEEEIRSMIHEGTKGGVVQEVEQDIVERVFLMGDLKVCTIMTHRSNVVALDVRMTASEIRDTLDRGLHAVYPLIDQTFDNVLGIILLKDLVFTYDNPDFRLDRVVCDPVYFHENMSVYKALEQMKEQRISQALICDEFGSCQGIVTLKDILEGLVGTIQESGEEAEIVKRAQDEGWLVDGQCALHDFLSFFDRESLIGYSNGSNTVSGLIFDRLQHLPQCGEHIEWHGFRFEIVDMDGARIDKILVLMMPED